MSQRIYNFENGHGASVITNEPEDGLFELAVLGPNGRIDYATPITDGVVGGQTKAQIADLLERIRALPRKEK